VAISGRQAAMEASDKVRQDLAKTGLVKNIAKSKWNPSQKIAWLGFGLDTELGKISIPQEKIQLLGLLEIILHCKEIKAKLLASITRKIFSMALGVGTVSRLMTRNLYSAGTTGVNHCLFPRKQSRSFFILV